MRTIRAERAYGDEGSESHTGDYQSIAIECNNVGVRLHRLERHDLAMRALCDAVHVMKSGEAARSHHPHKRVDVAPSHTSMMEMEMILASNYHRLESCEFAAADDVSTTTLRKAERATVAHGRASSPSRAEKDPCQGLTTEAAAARSNGEAVESAILIYSEPILIDSPSYSWQNAETTSTIVFNMALSHHMYGMKHGHRPSVERAMALYEMAHVAASSLLKTDASLTRRSPSRVLTIIMASLNNLGQIHYALQQLQATLVYFDEMSRMYKKHGCDGGAPSSWSGFWTNLFMFDCPNSAPAA